MQLSTWILISHCLAVTAQASTDPCSSPSVLNGAPRQLQVQTSKPFCDKDLPPGWYRFTPGTGEVAMKKVQRNHCGGETTVWMKGDLPLKDQLINRTFCFNHIEGVNGGCLWSEESPVKNCGDYLVYHFPLTSMACPMTVCTDPSIQPCPTGEHSKTGFKPCEKEKCPPGKWSPSGYKPCSDPYPMLGNVSLSPPEKAYWRYMHTCHFESNDTSRYAVFNITWSMNGQPVKVDPVSNPIRNSVFQLSEWDGHINQDLTCSVQTYYSSRPNMTSPETRSNSYFGGLKFKPTNVVLKEGVDDTIEVVSTLPIDCGGILLGSMCKLDLHLISEKLYTTSGCKLTLTSAMWNSSTHEAKVPVEITSVVDPAVKPDYNAIVEIHAKPNQALNQFLKMWNNVTLGNVKVLVKDGGSKSCVSTGDPHFSSAFNYHHNYNLYHLGDFNFASDMNGPIVVQIETNTWRPTHLPIISALAVQTGDDVTTIETMGGSRWATISTNRNLTSQTVQSCGTNEYQITTPKGHRLNIYPRGDSSHGFYIDVKLAFPIGLIPVIHYTSHDGRQIPITSLDTCAVEATTDGKGSFGRSAEIASSIIDKFRVPENENLFKGHLLSIPKPAGKQYCSCAPDASGTDVQPQCSTSKAKDPLVDRPSCTIFNPKVITDPPAQTRPGEHSFKEYQPIVHSWPTQSGITETQAKTKCKDTILKSVPAECAAMKNLNLDNAVSDCAADVQASNGYDYVASAAEAFKAMCESAVLSNPQNYVNNTPPAIVSNQCPNMCSMRGKCVNGACQCEPDWTFEDCSVKKGEPFKITAIDGGMTCDRATNDDCFQPLLRVENLANLTTCFVDSKLYFFGRPTVDDKSLSGNCKRINGHTIRVDLPKESTFAKHYQIEVIDPSGTSSSIDYVIYDGVCQRCGQDFTCYEKENACLINNACYLSGEPNPVDPSQSCRPEVSVDSWTDVGATAAPVQIDHNIRLG